MEEIDFSKLKSYGELKAEQEALDPKATTPVVPEVEDPEKPEDEEELEEELETDDKEPAPTDDKSKEPKAPWGQPGKVPKGIQDRFRKFTTKIAELEKLVASKNAPVKTEEETYDLSDPQQLARYIEAQVDARTEAKAEAQRQQAAIQRDFEEMNAVWTKNFEQAKDDLPDYDEVLNESRVILPKQTLQYLVKSDVGPYVSYTVAKNDELQDEINTLAPAERHAKILEVEKTVRQFLSTRTKAPAATPAKGSSVPAKPQLKVPGSSVKRTGGKPGALDLATADINDLLGI